MTEPLTCDCSEPMPDGLGECQDCLRLVLAAPRTMVTFAAASAPTVSRLAGETVAVRDGDVTLTWPTAAALAAWLRAVQSGVAQMAWRESTDEALRLAMHPPHKSTVEWTPEQGYATGGVVHNPTVISGVSHRFKP